VTNLGVNYKDAGRIDESIPLLEEAYDASNKLPAIRWVGRALFEAYTTANKIAEAAKLTGGLIQDARQTLPKASPELASQLAQLGFGLLKMQGYAEAEPLLRESLTIRETKQPDDWTTFNTRSLLGGSLLGQKKFAEAELLLLQGYEGLNAREQTIPPQGAIRIPEALERLVALYTAWHAAEPDKGYDVEAAEWQKKLAQRQAATAADAQASTPE
jgi:tetratricopeptide (TPR) repeat protein